MQRTLFGERFLDIAASYVKRFVERFDPRRLYVFFSGGKDSAAALAAVAYAGDSVVKRTVVVYNELVGNTHPWNVEQAYRVLRRLGFGEPVVVESPPYERIPVAVLGGARVLHIRARSRMREDFWGAVMRWGIPVLRPSGKFGRRWCYNEFKEKHWRVLPPERGNKRFVVVGVKATDSHWRRTRWLANNPEAREWVRVFEWRGGGRRVVDYAVSPILRLTTEQVWQLLGEAGLRGELRTYEACGDSLNCVFCPLRSLEKQRRVLECVAGSGEGRAIIARALEALMGLERAKPDSLTRRKAEEWLGLLRGLVAESTAQRRT